MTPYKRIPRRHFTDHQFNPYFKSNAYLDRVEKTQKKNKEDISKFFAFIKKVLRIK